MHQNPLSILAFFTPFIILYLSKICRFTAYILTIVKKIVAHNSSYYLFINIKKPLSLRGNYALIAAINIEVLNDINNP